VRRTPRVVLDRRDERSTPGFHIPGACAMRSADASWTRGLGRRQLRGRHAAGRLGRHAQRRFAGA
jgi:hypothetical protein